MIISIIKAIYFNQYSIIYTTEVTSLCWRPFLNVGDKKKYVGDIFQHVDDIPTGHQHHYTPECDVGALL